MTTSLFLARALGLYLIIIGFFYLFRRHFLLKAARQIFENEALIIITALMSLIVGILMVVAHSIWVWDWPLAITLLAYLALIKGIARLFIPFSTDKRVSMKVVEGDTPIYIGIVCLIIGFFLIYEGFFAV